MSILKKFGKKIDAGLRSAGQKFKESQTPEARKKRREQRMSRMKDQQEMLKEKIKLTEMRGQLQKVREKNRPKPPKMPNPFGGM